ncbi:MAG: CBS domain-containing protein [Spirochaetia bacterium]|nr:CBS domain-containing protein [Spirochaetia bacterium]
MTNSTVENFMTKSPVIIHENTSLEMAWKMLKEHTFKHLPVLNDQEEITGILSSTDVEHLSTLFENSIENSKGDVSLFLKNLLVKDVMTFHVVTITKEKSIEDANDLLLAKGIRALPVEESGKIIGIISETDILHYFNQKYKT